MQVVHAGRVGVFSRSRNQEQLAVIEEGAAVEEGQLLGYIEVLNVLNEVHAPYAGTLERFLVESRQPVEYGQPLALIEPAPEPPNGRRGVAEHRASFAGIAAWQAVKQSPGD